jgi:hypothetical protein
VAREIAAWSTASHKKQQPASDGQMALFGSGMRRRASKMLRCALTAC